jgi:flagellar basal-body rod protein FlgF
MIRESDPVPITVPEGSITVSTDGTISSQGTVVAQLNLVAFSKDTQLTSEGSAYFQAPKDAARPASEVAVRQGSLEASNYNPVEGTVDLITVQRHAQLLERALSIFDSDFAQAATQDLPRVE